jgi:hypothetical protein
MTLEEICQKENTDIQQCIEKLNKKGINANPKSTLREIAFPNGLTPVEVMEIIKKQ